MSDLKYTDKRINVITGKLGLTESQAVYCIGKHKKYAIWIANQIKDFNIDINSIDDDNKIDRILDWKREAQEVNLNELNFKQALKIADKYFDSIFIKTSKSLKNKNVVLDCGQYKWVQLKTVEDCVEEGNAMGHCIGNSNHSQSISQDRSIAFSLRDKYNKPHLTLEAPFNKEHNKFGKIFEFKGSKNQTPNVEYVKYFIDLLKKYDFQGYTDSNLYKSLENSFELVNKINTINSEFFPFEIKLSLGLDCFGEQEIFINDISINVKDLKNINLPKGIMFYTNVSIQAEEINISDDIIIGGNLYLSASKISIGENVKIAGSLTILNVKNIEISDNIIVFGDILVKEDKARRKIKKSITCEGFVTLYNQ
jgi:acetyltransferase-like isoleucine patch superfamily enzyme